MDGEKPRGRPSDLAALSAATDAYSRKKGRRGSDRPATHWAIAFFAALCVGGITAVSLPSDYICAATLKFEETPTMAQRATARKELLDFAWNEEATRSLPDSHRRDWFVNAPSDVTLRLCLRVDHAAEGLAQAHRLATAFCAALREKSEKLRATPTEGERALSQQVSVLETQLQSTHAELEKAIAAKPQDDPSGVQSTLLVEWERLRRRFAELRSRLATANDRYDTIKNDHEPPDAIVSTEDRRAALEADAALQQDLGELTVNLTEAKLELLRVWKQSAEPLERLQNAAKELAATDPAEIHADDTTRPLVERLRDAAVEYNGHLDGFSAEWDREFEALKRRPVDPMAGEVLNLYSRSRTRLGDFLFQAGGRLAELRSVVDGIADLGGSGARYHVLHAALLRRFRAMQTAHHRLEFAAGNIESSHNFRLDIALRGARGLFRRTKARVTDIDQRLQETAQREAIAERAAELKELESVLGSMRESAYGVMERLIAIQEDLHVNAGVTKAYLESSLRADFSEGWIDTTESQLGGAQEALAKLTGDRIAASAAPAITLDSVDIIGRSVEVAERLRVGSISAVVTLLIVGIAQVWMRRRAMPVESA